MILNLSGITPTSSFMNDEKAETSSLKSTEPNEKQPNRTYPTNDRTTQDLNMPDSAMDTTNNEKYPMSNVPEVKLTMRYNKYKVESKLFLMEIDHSIYYFVPTYFSIW